MFGVVVGLFVVVVLELVMMGLGFVQVVLRGGCGVLMFVVVGMVIVIVGLCVVLVVSLLVVV
jgi:hypothetical protein